MIIAFATDADFDHVELYRAFIERETDASGTVVLHHGRVKRPGKQVPGFAFVELRALVPDPGERLTALARRAQAEFGLNQVLVAHRLGTITVGDSVLLAIVSAATRDACFRACSWIVDEIKKEDVIELVERA